MVYEVILSTVTMENQQLIISIILFIKDSLLGKIIKIALLKNKFNDYE